MGLVLSIIFNPGWETDKLLEKSILWREFHNQRRESVLKMKTVQSTVRKYEITWRISDSHKEYFIDHVLISNVGIPNWLLKKESIFILMVELFQLPLISLILEPALTVSLENHIVLANLGILEISKIKQNTNIRSHLDVSSILNFLRENTPMTWIINIKKPFSLMTWKLFN